MLLWWKEKEAKWPNLAKMVKQYFAVPASSAGVERVFSAAGKMHGSLSKSAKDTKLEHSLFAAFNTDWSCAELVVSGCLFCLASWLLQNQLFTNDKRLLVHLW